MLLCRRGSCWFTERPAPQKPAPAHACRLQTRSCLRSSQAQQAPAPCPAQQLSPGDLSRARALCQISAPLWGASSMHRHRQRGQPLGCSCQRGPSRRRV